MIAVDTNVLLRYLLGDDETQSKKVTKLINGSKKALITDIVLVEAIWTLTGKKYKVDKDGIINVVNALFQEPNICFEDGHVVWCALNDYRKATTVRVGSKKKQADFSDTLIVNKANAFTQIEGEALEGSYTFDIAAQQLSGAKKP